MVQVSRNVLPNKMQLYFVQYNKDRLRKILWSLLKEKAVNLKLHANRQQLPTLLGQQCWELLCLCWQWCANGCNNSQQCWPFMRGPSRKVIALLTSPKVIMCYAGTFCYTSKAIMEQMKCWELLAQRFYRFETLPSNSQKYATTSNRARLCSSISWWPTALNFRSWETRKSCFLHNYATLTGHPGFYRFRALGFLQFFLEHGLVRVCKLMQHVTSNNVATLELNGACSV